MYATSSVRAVIIKKDNVIDLEDHNCKGYLQEEKQNKNPQITFKKRRTANIRCPLPLFNNTFQRAKFRL
jgi:hypothetical protein